MIRLLLTLSLSATLATAQHVCSVTHAGDGCAPITITLLPQGNSGGHDLTLTATGLHAHRAGAMVWGDVAINVPVIPGSMCPLLTNYIWGHTFISSWQGSYTWSRNWPAAHDGFFYMQMGTLSIDNNGNADVITTDCKFVQCVQP